MNLTLNTVYALILRLINGSVTLFIAYPLYQFYQKTRRRFYFYWSAGFALYGLNIIIRLFTDFALESNMMTYLTTFIVFAWFMMMFVGIGELIERTMSMFLVGLLLPFSIMVQYVLDIRWGPIATAAVLLSYFLIWVSLLIIQLGTRIDLKLLLTGWTSILFINIAFIQGYIDPGFTDFLSACFKIVIYLGMTQSTFSYMADDLQQFPISGIPVERLESFTGRVSLLNLVRASKQDEVEWIKERTIENSKKGVRTILFVVYDLISPREVMVDEDLDLYLVRIIGGSRGLKGAFEERITTVNDNVNQIGLMVNNIISFSQERKIPCEIILYTLSHMIHTHGWRRTYTFITSKIPMIKASQVKVTLFYYPTAHENASDIIKFEKIADTVDSK